MRSSFGGKRVEVLVRRRPRLGRRSESSLHACPAYGIAHLKGISMRSSLADLVRGGMGECLRSTRREVCVRLATVDILGE